MRAWLREPTYRVHGEFFKLGLPRTPPARPLFAAALALNLRFGGTPSRSLSTRPVRQSNILVYSVPALVWRLWVGLLCLPARDHTRTHLAVMFKYCVGLWPRLARFVFRFGFHCLLVHRVSALWI